MAVFLLFGLYTRFKAFPEQMIFCCLTFVVGRVVNPTLTAEDI
jgi:hypothetical protein